MSDGGLSATKEGHYLTLPDLDVQELEDPKFLRAVAKKYNVDSTKSLVAAYNTATDKEERGVLIRWVRQYIGQKDEYTTPDSVLEFAELAKIIPRTAKDKDLLRKMVYMFRPHLNQGEFLEENATKALLYVLTWVDLTVYDDSAQLIALVKKLLLSLSSEPRLTKRNFATREANFLCIHQVFFILQSIDPANLLEEEKKMLRRQIAEKKEELELSMLCYPVSFQFELIRQAVERLEIEDAPSRLTQARRLAASGLHGAMHVFHLLRQLAGGDINPTSIEDAYRRGRAAIANAGVLEREWYDVLQILTAARIRVMKEEKKCELLALAYDAAMEGQRKTTRENDQKALRFGIVQEMALLASDRDSRQDSREEATTKLIELATNQAISENWIHDVDILTEILDVLHVIYSISEQNREILEAIRKIQQSCDEHGKGTLTVWLDGNTMEEKLRIQRREDTNNEYADLFAKTGATVGYLHPSTIRFNIEDLKKTYLHDNFATVQSLFGSEVHRHVKDMEHHIVVYGEIVEQKRIERREEQSTEGGGHKTDGESFAIHGRNDPEEYGKQKRNTTAISIEDLFKPRSFEAGVDKRGIRRVLLYGNPGSGKTCIGKAIAHKWALGEMFQEFKSIYVIPIRRLNIAKTKGIRGEALEEVVAQLCFKQKASDDEFEKLKTQINDDLDMSSTLLVFDGLDEADDDARDLLSEADKGKCKLLLLTRPYNLRGIQTKVDCQFECLGFNDQQLRNYINKELHKDKASRLTESLHKNREMWEIVHIPVAAHILCSMSKKAELSLKVCGKEQVCFGFTMTWQTLFGRDSKINLT